MLENGCQRSGGPPSRSGRAAKFQQIAGWGHRCLMALHKNHFLDGIKAGSGLMRGTDRRVVSSLRAGMEQSRPW